MTSVTETVTVHTVPSEWLSWDNGRTDEPYRRVVGIQTLEMPDVVWSRTEWFNTSEYDPAEAVAETLTMPSVFARRLGSFFVRFFVDDPRAQPALPQVHPDQIEEYNCHRFGYWMTGDPAAYKLEFPDAPGRIARDGYEMSGSLPVGKHGVICVPGNSGYRVPWHSVVGLGEDNPDCIQVMDTGGYIGIDTYDNVRNLYQRLAKGRKISLRAL